MRLFLQSETLKIFKKDQRVDPHINMIILDSIKSAFSSIEKLFNLSQFERYKNNKLGIQVFFTAVASANEPGVDENNPSRFSDRQYYTVRGFLRKDKDLIVTDNFNEFFTDAFAFVSGLSKKGISGLKSFTRWLFPEANLHSFAGEE